MYKCIFQYKNFCNQGTPPVQVYANSAVHLCSGLLTSEDGTDSGFRNVVN